VHILYYRLFLFDPFLLEDKQRLSLGGFDMRALAAIFPLLLMCFWPRLLLFASLFVGFYACLGACLFLSLSGMFWPLPGAFSFIMVYSRTSRADLGAFNLKRSFAAVQLDRVGFQLDRVTSNSTELTSNSIELHFGGAFWIRLKSL